MRRAIFYWEAKRRLDLLIAFRKQIEDFYATATWDTHANEWEEDADAKALRQQINEAMRDVEVAVRFVGIVPTIFYSPPPVRGGPTGNMSLLDNLFILPNLGLSHLQLVDHLDQAIGIYRSWLGPLWRKLFNPFYWLGWGLTLVAEIPFRILGAAGFNAEKLEGSLLGKLVKAAIQMITATAGVLGVLEKLGLLGP